MNPTKSASGSASPSGASSKNNLAGKGIRKGGQTGGGALGANLVPKLKGLLAELQQTNIETVWWACHALFCLHAVLYTLGFGYAEPAKQAASTGFLGFLLKGILSPFTLAGLYRRGTYFLLAAYSIVIYRSVKASSQPKGALEWVSDMNALYAALAGWLFLSEPIGLLYLTLSVYSLYHVISWPAARASIPPVLQNALIAPLLAHQATVTQIAAHLEWLSLFYILSLVLVGQASLASFFVYASFLRFSYAANPRARSTLAIWHAQLTALTQKPSVPPAVRNGYVALVEQLAKLAPPTTPAAAHPRSD